MEVSQVLNSGFGNPYNSEAQCAEKYIFVYEQVII
jgi:hypothetical protein